MGTERGIKGRGLMAPRVDFVFRSLFGGEKNKDILLGLLNAVLKRKGKK